MSDQMKLIGATAMDLKRVALGLYRHNSQLTDTFLNEIESRNPQIDQTLLKPYVIDILNKINKDLIPDDALMYSTLLQNYTLSQYSR